MNIANQDHTESLYKAYLDNLVLQGKSKSTIDSYSRAFRRLARYCDCRLDKLTVRDLKSYFLDLCKSRSWSIVKIERSALKFFYTHVLERPWKWVNIVKPPQYKTLPDILSPTEVALLISATRELRFKVFF